ncbi:uncharacterized protein FYW61_003065 isoform 1-T1 [Anableps anableps]
MLLYVDMGTTWDSPGGADQVAGENEVWASLKDAASATRPQLERSEDLGAELLLSPQQTEYTQEKVASETSNTAAVCCYFKLVKLHSPHSARPGQEHSWPDLVEPVDRRMERSPPRARFLRKHAQVWGL